MNEYGAMASQSAHKNSQFKKHVVPQSGLSGPSRFNDVVELRDRDGKIRFTHGFLQCLKRIASGEKDALVPDRAKNLVLQLALYFVSNLQGFRRGDYEEFCIFVWWRNQVIALQ